MSKRVVLPDQREREQALDPRSSILVQAPAGSGKTELLTRRFLRLLGEVNSPGEIVAITFTNAAAAEMRSRILEQLESVAHDASPSAAQNLDELSSEALARRAMHRARLLEWNLLDTPSQLRIMTIDSFCREIAIQQPLLSGLGGGIAISEQSENLYRRAAQRTLERIDGDDAVSSAIATLLAWRDNNWHEMESLLVDMLAQRDRWMHDLVLNREPDWDEIRAALERPFANALRTGLNHVSELLDQAQGARDEALTLARFACEQMQGRLHTDLAELADFPYGPFDQFADLEGAQRAHVCLANLLLTNDGAFRSRIDKNLGFPSDRKTEKSRMLAFLSALRTIDNLESALASVRSLPPARYTEDDWEIVRACFVLLRHAAGELQVVFAESGTADFTEVAQIALRVLKDEDGLPTDTALDVADGIRHLLVDEFQDTSRRQHDLLRRLVAAWPEREGRTVFAVGDPMQSIYFFRGADAELFPRVRDLGLEVDGAEPLHLDYVPLSANFRTAPRLVERLNIAFDAIFSQPDGSGIAFAPATAAREAGEGSDRFHLHLRFVPRGAQSAAAYPDAASEKETAHEEQIAEIVELIRRQLPAIEGAQAEGGKHRVAVLGRTKRALAPVAAALRRNAIPFRAVDLEELADRPEVLDALALARALMNPEDRVAWLGVLRAPWCGLALDDLHKLASDDNAEITSRPVPQSLAGRLHLLSDYGQSAAGRVLRAIEAAPALRAALPIATLGTRLEQVWLSLGGADCVDATARANLDLLWSCLDRLTGDEQDLLGPALNAALKKLTALPDPDAGTDCGVQLMTVHKAKGLEFEVVIVPELQARGRLGEMRLLSWMERGLAKPDASNDTTEFLIAPLQTKGADRGDTKAWVDRMRQEREAQETRRTFYVAATRAREELHLFARPEYKVEKDGSLTLSEPRNSLFATAWPALESLVHAQFDDWIAAEKQREPDPAEIASIAAAAAQSNLFEMPSLAKATILRRLPQGYTRAEDAAAPANESHLQADTAVAGSLLYRRHEGGLLSRAFGRAVHSMLEELARLRVSQDWDASRASLPRRTQRIESELRGLGVAQRQAADIAAQALRIALDASRDGAGQWVLSPHSDASSEVRWAGVIDGSLRTVQVDRVFRGGSTPQSQGADCWWIVDYKSYSGTQESAPGDDLLTLRAVFAPQLEAYAKVLRNLIGKSDSGKDAPIFAGLYYPRMLKFDWWET